MNLTKRQISRLLRPYQLGNLIDVFMTKEGILNAVYGLQTDKGRFILRLAKTKKRKKDIMYEILLLNSIKGLPVPRYIADSKGEFINSCKGRYYSVYRYIKGVTPSSRTKILLKQAAIFLAKFHNQTTYFKSTITKKFAWYKFPEERLRKIMDLLLKSLKKYTPEILFIEKELRKNMLPEFIPRGPVNNDFRRENFLVNGDKLTGVIDFDNAQVGTYIEDIGEAVMWLCADKKGLNLKKTYRFIREYEKYRKLSKIEKRYLFQALKFAFISHLIIDYYIFPLGLGSEDKFQFHRKVFLSAYKKLNRIKFRRCVESRFAFINNLIF